GVGIRNDSLIVGDLLAPMRLAASPFIGHDAIVGLTQPLTEALNELTSVPRRAGDPFEELGWREEFCVNFAGGSGGRTTWAVLQNAHFSDKLPGANRAQKDEVTIQLPEHFDGAGEQAEDTVCAISLFEKDLPFGKVDVAHESPFNRQQRSEMGKALAHRSGPGPP